MDDLVQLKFTTRAVLLTRQVPAAVVQILFILMFMWFYGVVLYCVILQKMSRRGQSSGSISGTLLG